MLRKSLSQLPRCLTALACRGAHGAAGPPLPPPSSIKNFPEYIEPKWVMEEHLPPVYRDMIKPTNYQERLATLFGVILWTWILLGFWYEPDHVYGHNPWPDASKWTDKELGIPAELDLEEMEVE